MLRLAKYLCVLIIIFCNSCNLFTGESGNKILNVSRELIGMEAYDSILKQLSDTLDMRVLNKLLYVEPEITYPYKVDSLLCFDITKSRLIACRHLYINLTDASSDDLQIIYGQKYENQWYFQNGASIVIPRSMVKGHDVTKPLSYEQLHKIALKEVYSGYLTAMGSINEDWFTSHFENVGMCADCKTREDFQRNIVLGAAAIWSTRDTTQPIKRLEKVKPLP